MIAATHVSDIDAPGMPPGAFEFFVAHGGDGAPVGMFYLCPCGCGRRGVLHFRPHPSPSWQWDGNRDKPTLSPSVHDMPNGKTHWHGYLRNGVWESC